MRTFLKVLIPFVIVALGSYAGWYIYQTRPIPKRKSRPPKPPLVRVAKMEPKDIRLYVTTQGTVRPRTETTLVPQVSGVVVEIAPSLAAGGFFENNEVLIRIDPRDYKLAVTQAESKVVAAKLAVAKIRAEADLAKREWAQLGKGQASELVLKAPQLADALASLRSAEANLELARLNLSRTVIKAPFAGRVRQESIDAGQYVTKGSKVAEIYAVDYAEVRLPLPDDELAYLELPLVYRNGHTDDVHPEVTLSSRFAGKTYEWRGEVTRTEGEIDARSRMIYAVAQIKNPYGMASNPGRPPLAAGLFVKARIKGRLAKGVYSLPRSALRGRDEVIIVDKKSRLHFRKVMILRMERDRLIIKSGLKPGEAVCLSQLQAAVEGMRVRVLGDEGGALTSKSSGPGGKKGKRKQP